MLCVWTCEVKYTNQSPKHARNENDSEGDRTIIWGKMKTIRFFNKTKEKKLNTIWNKWKTKKTPNHRVTHTNKNDDALTAAKSQQQLTNSFICLWLFSMYSFACFWPVHLCYQCLLLYFVFCFNISIYWIFLIIHNAIHK